MMFDFAAAQLLTDGAMRACQNAAKLIDALPTEKRRAP